MLDHPNSLGHGLHNVGADLSESNLGRDTTVLDTDLSVWNRTLDVNLAEINEAFASVPVAACRQLGLSEDITNVSGSGCSLGHPVACTGARMIITTMYELRRRGGGIGLASMCAGGGMGSTTVFEVYPG